MFVSVIFITTGYSAFQTNLNISGEATVRAQADIRITNVTVSAVSSNTFSTYEKYNVNNITSGADLPNENSTITYTVEVTNFGNVEEAINSITGLPSNLEVKSIGGYTLKDTICDQNNECTLGISKSIPITIGDKEGAYNSSNTHFDIELDLAFKRVFNITYHGIVNHNYPDRILEDDTLEITFVTDIPESVSVSGVGQQNYSSGVLTISNPTQNVIISDLPTYRYDGDIVFTGSNYIDTGIKLFSSENKDRNFEVSFIVKSLDSTQTNQAVMFGDMSEAGNPYPGIVFRTAKANNENFQIVANSNSTNSGSQFAYSANTHIVIRRLNDHIYYSTDGGEHFTNYTAAEYSSFTNPFNVNATFGAGIDGSGNPFRYLIGTLSDLKIDVTERDSYIINYNANGGTGSMDSQSNYVGRSYALRKNTFTKTNKIFKEWNTKADGTGTSYHDEQTVTDIANADESVTLYAQWTDPVSYNVSFNANGGTGSMADQTFYIGSTQRLRTNTFTKTGSEFIEWNTKADGTGNHYRDAESVKDLTNTANTTVTLYAQWTKSEYYHSGVVDFDGNTYINTGVRLFDATNINKDFTISFTIESAENVSSQTSLATIISTMDEAHGSPWPGVVLHRNNTNNYYVIEINVTATNSARVDITDNMDIVIQRRNGVVSYSIDGGSTFESTTGDYNNLSSGRYFSDMVLIGASPNQNGIGVRRTFKGRIKNISVVRNDS